MTSSLPLSVLTQTHTAVSFVALLAALALMCCLVFNFRCRTLVVVFLATSVLTDVTGFLFPLKLFGLARWLGVLSLCGLGLALAISNSRRKTGWGRLSLTFVAYIDLLAGLIAAFQFLPFLKPLAPELASTPLTFRAFLMALNQPVFFAAQLALALLFVGIAFALCLRRQPHHVFSRRP